MTECAAHAAQHPCVAEGSESNVAVGVQDLPSGVLLTGMPSVVEQNSSDLVLTQAVVNSAPVEIYGTTYGPGTAVLFHRAGGLAGQEYVIRVQVSTDAAPADVIVGYLSLTVTRARAAA